MVTYDGFQSCAERKDLAVDARFPHPTSYQLCILRSEVEYDDRLVLEIGLQKLPLAYWVRFSLRAEADYTLHRDNSKADRVALNSSFVCK